MTIYNREGRPVVELALHTRVPEKWLAVDRETGDVWAWVEGKWRRANVDVIVTEKGEDS